MSGFEVFDPAEWTREGLVIPTTAFVKPRRNLARASAVGLVASTLFTFTPASPIAASAAPMKIDVSRSIGEALVFPIASKTTTPHGLESQADTSAAALGALALNMKKWRVVDEADFDLPDPVI